MSPPAPFTDLVHAQQQGITEPIVRAMDRRRRLTREALLDELERTIYEAMRTVLSKTGEPIEVPDGARRFAALLEAFTLRHEYPAKQVDVTGKIHMEQVLAHLDLRQEEAIGAAKVVQVVAQAVTDPVTSLPPVMAEDGADAPGAG